MEVVQSQSNAVRAAARFTGFPTFQISEAEAARPPEPRRRRRHRDRRRDALDDVALIERRRDVDTQRLISRQLAKSLSSGD